MTFTLKLLKHKKHENSFTMPVTLNNWFVISVYLIIFVNLINSLSNCFL